MNIFGDKKRILITGGGGFIGGFLVKRLLENNEISIVNIDKCSHVTDWHNLEKFSSFINYKFYKLDLSNYQETEKIVKDFKPNIIFHFAAESHVDNSIVYPIEFIRSNIIGTFNLLEASKNLIKDNEKFKKNFLFYHISTDEVFGSAEREVLFDESSKYDPRSPYSATKASSDHLVSSWHHTFDIPIVITNCSNNFGPRQHPEKLIPKAIYNSFYNEKIPLYGNGLNIRDWLFVEDHIDAILMVARSGKIGQKYCIGGSNQIRNRDLLELICSKMDKRIPNKAPHKRLITLVRDRPGHDKRYAINSSKIKNELGWFAKYDLDRGLDITVDWYLKNIKWFSNKNLDY